MIVSPAKTAEPIEMHFGMWIKVGTRNCVFEGSRYPMAWGTFEGNDFSIFPKMPLSAILSGPDVGISPHAVDHGSNWLVAEAMDTLIFSS